MRGYWNDPERTAESIDQQRWMHTGDLATMDEQGYVRVVGRIKDMVIRGGENVYPREIEEFLYTPPEGRRRAGHRRPRRALRRGADGVDRAAARRADAPKRRSENSVAGRSRDYKIPRYVKFVDSYPMTVTGKVQKFKMRETAVQELGLDKAAAIATA